ncbi:MAG: hypothetical protein FJ095_18120 [Deltaproteobacteria bacterium]|nr:hypothetical protein [Deltaproteobacteria bacterium]
MFHRWNDAFDLRVVDAVDGRDPTAPTTALATDDGRLEHPSPDHFLALLYAAGAASADDPVSYPVMGMDLGALSMRALRWG